MITIILGLALFLMSISTLVFYLKYKKLNSKVNKVISNLKSPLRKGHYQGALKITNGAGLTEENFYPIIYVKELDRFTNGESKIEIDYIETCISEDRISSEKVKKYIETSFKSVVKTSDITWLESENAIKESRRNKLEHLKESIK